MGRTIVVRVEKVEKVQTDAQPESALPPGELSVRVLQRGLTLGSVSQSASSPGGLADIDGHR